MRIMEHSQQAQYTKLHKSGSLIVVLLDRERALVGAGQRIEVEFPYVPMFGVARYIMTWDQAIEAERVLNVHIPFLHPEE